MLNNPVSCHLITWGQHFDQALQEVEELGFHACEPFPKDALKKESLAICRDYRLGKLGLRL